MRPSIRRRLLLTLLSITTLVWLITALEGYRESRHEMEELFDAQLAQSARTLLSVAGHELAELEGVPEEAHIHFLSGEDGSDYEKKLAYQLWLYPQNRLVLRSFTAPEAPLSALRDGYTTETIRGEPWRVFSLHDPASGFVIKMGESLAIREELSNEITLRLTLPMLLALPLLALLIYLGIGRGLAPLRRLTGAIVRREPQRLEPVDTGDVPAEIEPLTNALNHLFERVEQSLENERRFTADAAHELRTPLAALKIQAQVAQRSRDEGERQRALAQLISGVERATRLIEQLLTLARLDPQRAQQGFSPVALRPLAEEVLAPLAAAKEVSLQLQCDDEIRVSADPDLLAIALRNLVDNAIRYTPQGGQVEVNIGRRDNGIALEVADSGPGIPEGERERVLGRFHRIAGQEVEGSGLGLSIVQRIAELHHATLTLEQSRLGGLAVRLQLPAMDG